MPGRRGNVRPLCQHPHSSANDGGSYPVRNPQYSGACVTIFEWKVGELRNSGQFLSTSQPIYISRAPGRLDLMGGNVDYTGGLVFQATIREATWAATQLRKDDRI